MKLKPATRSRDDRLRSNTDYIEIRKKRRGMVRGL
jgi:hypothetical protein